MPNFDSVVEGYWIRPKTKKFHDNLSVRNIYQAGNKNKKYKLIVGVDDLRDADYLGEILGVVRPEDPKRSYYQSWTVDTILRGSDKTLERMNSRELINQNDIELLSSSGERIIKEWSELTLMNFVAISSLLKSTAIRSRECHNRQAAGRWSASLSSSRFTR